MVISDKLKKVIFKKLYEDLSHVEIIPYKNSIYFIDRETKFWYFEYTKKKVLYWRYPFFQSFFNLFSIKQTDFTPIISEWVEEVLNSKVVKSHCTLEIDSHRVEEALNYKVLTTHLSCERGTHRVEEALNCKVLTTHPHCAHRCLRVEEVLNS